MKKAIKKLMAALLAVAMVCAMAIPAFADTESIREHHSFKAFQIFKGNVNDASEISNVEWGSCIHDYHDFLAELKKDPTLSTPFQDADSLQKVLAVSAHGMNPMITASLLRVLYATISTRLQTQTRNPSFQLPAMSSKSPMTGQVII